MIKCRIVRPAISVQCCRTALEYFVETVILSRGGEAVIFVTMAMR